MLQLFSHLILFSFFSETIFLRSISISVLLFFSVLYKVLLKLDIKLQAVLYFKLRFLNYTNCWKRNKIAKNYMVLITVVHGQQMKKMNGENFT